MNVSRDQVVTSVIIQSDPKPSILIADDSRVVRVSLKNILQEDYNIIEAVDGTEAWRILLNGSNIKLVLSDLSMPNLDGIGLLRKLRQSDDESVRNTPFIIITGKEEDQEIREHLLSEGANELISKPFDSHEITQQAKKHTSQQSTSKAIPTTDSGQLFKGISDKSQFTLDVRKELSFAIRNKNELALLLLKLDQFETIQKHYSDPAIEHILITTAEIIRAHMRIEDKAAYFGDGIFAILLPASNVITTRYLGKRVLTDLVAKRFYLGESGSSVTASIGVSAPEIKPGTIFSELLGLAQQRLQAAINAGGNRVVEKGTATITPVTTLISDNPDESSLHRKLLRQTEKEMRELALEEVRKSKAGQAQDTEAEIKTPDPKEINDELQLIKQENKIIKDELVQLRQQSEKDAQLKKQLHETTSLQQQTQLKLQQLSEDFETMRIRAEEAESDQSRLEESESDRSIIEEHLLQDSEQLQIELKQANQHNDQTLADLRNSERAIAALKEQLKYQKEEFNLELAEEHMLRSMAEQKLADLQHKQQTQKKDTNPFALTSIPTITPVERPVESRSVHSSQATPKQPVRQKPVAAKSIKTATRRTTSQHKPEKPKRSKLFLVFALLVAGIAGYLFWQTNGSAHETRSKQINHAAALTAQPADSEQSKTKTDAQKKSHFEGQAENKASDAIRGITPTPLSAKRPAQSQQMEEAILQAELIIRQTAEEEFQALLKEQQDPPS